MNVRLSISSPSPRLTALWKEAIPLASVHTESLEDMMQRSADVFFVPASIAERLGGEPSTETHQYFFHPGSGNLMVTPRILRQRPRGADADVVCSAFFEILHDLSMGGDGVIKFAIHDSTLQYDRSAGAKEFFESLTRQCRDWQRDHPGCLEAESA